MSSINEMRNGKREKQNAKQQKTTKEYKQISIGLGIRICVCTHFPSSSLRSYSSVKRVVVTSEFDIGVLLVTVAMLIIEVVVGGDTFILLSVVVVGVVVDVVV